MSLHRAFAYLAHGACCTEVVVFFESASSEPQAALRALLAAAWRAAPEQIDIYNCRPERDLLEQAFGTARDGDARLFEIGWDGRRPLYAQRDRVQLLVGPTTLHRLADAQRLAEALTKALAKAR